ncbi:MAG: hypothetical protein LBD63_02635, partial [Mycoplasmataceae bacterium]|nr:hypothetical protein [Mycoplasmataceae bacterium]
NNASIASRAFLSCTNLSNIYIPADAMAPLSGPNDLSAFDNCSLYGTIWYHNDSQAALANSFKNAFTAFKDNVAWSVQKIPTP